MLFKTNSLYILWEKIPFWQQKIDFAVQVAVNFGKLHKNRKNRPSISAVIVGRNDDYMPNFSQRLRATISHNIKHLVDEVIFVEWNPPENRELLSVSLTEEFEQVRSYVVPGKIHQQVCQNPNLPLLEYHAKNVGIRRAKFPWIIATNADIVFGYDTICKIRQSLPSKKIVWIAQRVDIDWEKKKKHEIGLFDCIKYVWILPDQEYGTGDFLLASQDIWQKIRGYDESLVKHRLGCDVRGAAQIVMQGYTIKKAGIVHHLAHGSSFTANFKLLPHHGEEASLDGLPYQNEENWGLNDCQEIEIAKRVWRLE